MDIFNRKNKSVCREAAKHLRLKTRIKESVEPTKGNVASHLPQRLFVTHLYTVKVQVKVFGLWLTVWAETCDYTDGDTRPYIKNCAIEVQEAITDKI